MTQTQVSMDQCSGEFIIKARAASISMEKSYERVKIYRVSALAACAIPGACAVAMEVLKGAMTAEKLFEESVEIYWKEQQAVWNMEVAVRCNLRFSTIRSAYPAFPYPIIDPNLGLAEFSGDRFLLSKPEPVVLWLRRKNLRSTAELKRRAKNDWTVRWTE